METSSQVYSVFKLVSKKYLYLTYDICKSFAASIFTLDRFVCNSICDDEENFRKVGVVWAEDNGVVAVER